MKFLHIESAKEHLETLNALTENQEIPFEIRLEMAKVVGSFKVIMENYEELWISRYFS